MEKLLTTAEVAERYGVTAVTVRNWVRAGLIAPLVITCRNFRFLGSALDAFEARTLKGAPAPPPLNAALPASPAKPRPARTLLTTEQMAQFERFWAVYPKKVSKGGAMAVWGTVNPDGTLTEAIVTGVQRAIEGDQRFRTHKYTPNPESWLKKAGWMDDHSSSDGTAQMRQMLEMGNRIIERQNNQKKEVGRG
jgi:hypothetical protein